MTDKINLIEIVPSEIYGRDTAHIDTSMEEPFTLETFDELITLHATLGKQFILARVISIDPSDSCKHYNSYYSAHYINKTIFRVSKRTGEIYRIDSRNPLNNMPIFTILYYKIQLEDPSSNVYKAQCIGNDVTYLKHAQIRRFFRQNSLCEKDCKLLEITNESIVQSVSAITILYHDQEAYTIVNSKSMHRISLLMFMAFLLLSSNFPEQLFAIILGDFLCGCLLIYLVSHRVNELYFDE